MRKRAGGAQAGILLIMNMRYSEGNIIAKNRAEISSKTIILKGLQDVKGD